MDPVLSPFAATTRPDEVVRALYRAFALRDLSRLATLLAPDTEWLGVEPGGDLHGREEALTWLEGLVIASDGTIAVRLQQLYTHPGGRVVTFHEMSRHAGSLRVGCLLWDVCGGSVRRVTPLSPASSGRPGRPGRTDRTDRTGAAG